MTECIRLSPLSDDDLLSALDGEADGSTYDHLQACAYCSARLERLRQLEQGVHKLMYRSACPPAGDLADYLMAVVTGAARRKTEQHLQHCALCQEEVQKLRTVMVVDEAPATLPETLWQQAKDWLRALEDDFVAVLVPRPLIAYGQLKGAEGHERILNYEHGSITVMLRLEKVVDGLKINGTIIDSAAEGQWAGGHAELTRTEAESERFLAVIDDDESFTIAHIPPGLFRLNIYAVAGRLLRLKDIDLTLLP